MGDGKLRIRKAAVLGAGVMGSRMAALLAGADIATLLLDIAPRELNQQDINRGLTRESPQFRNRLARAGIDAALGAIPPAFFGAADARLVTPGNLEDHLSRLADADWVIEAVAEDPEVKAGLLKRIDGVLRPGGIITTSTSGLSIARLSESLSRERQPFFLGAHFFNPPRHTRLL